MKKFSFIVTFISIGLSQLSNAQWGGGGSSYTHYEDYKKAVPQPPAKPTCVVNVKKTIRVKGTLDGKGCLYQWRGSGYPNKCHRGDEISEGEARMFIMEKGAKIKNLQMECSLDGILMNDNTSIENVINRDCEEDCVTTNGKNNTIINNSFYLCQDKCIQLNKASNVVIENNKFFHALRPMSGSGKKSGGATGIKATGNTCYNCEIMIRAQRNHDVTAKNNSLEKGECMFETVEKAVIYDAGGNTVKNATLKCSDGTGNIKKISEVK